MSVFDNSLINLMNKSLDGLWTRQEVISDNVANFETPNYKRKVVSFEDELKNVLSNTALKKSEINQLISEQSAVTYEVENQAYRLDGNGVDLEQESMEMVRTAYQYMYAQRMLTDQFSRLGSAIREGR